MRYYRKAMRLMQFAWCLVVAMFVSSARFAPPSAHTPVSRVTFTQDIGPLLQRRCAGCHRENGFAPMPLQTYADARKAAQDIREEVQEGRMPPWPAARGFGDHANDRSLTALEIGLLTTWTMGLTPLGPDLRAPGAEAPPRPDVTMTSAPSGERAGVHVVNPASRRDRWIVGWAFQPANPNAQRAVIATDAGAYIGSWVPPEGAIRYPAGAGVRLPAGARIVLDIQHRKVAEESGGVSAAGGTLSLYLADSPRTGLQHRILPCGSTRIDAASDVVGVEADAASAGDSVEVVATRPDGSVEPLCLIPRFQPGYRPMLRLRRPVDLPAGSTIDVRSTAEGCSAGIEFIVRSR